MTGVLVAQVRLTAPGCNIRAGLNNQAISHFTAPPEVGKGICGESGRYTGILSIATRLLGGHTTSSRTAGDTPVTFQGRAIRQHQSENKSQQQNLHHS